MPQRTRILGIPDPSPAIDDIVIRSCLDCPTDYTVGVDHAPAQFRYSAYASALDVAKRWAARQHIDVWFHDRGREFILLSRHRRDASWVAAPESVSYQTLPIS